MKALRKRDLSDFQITTEHIILKLENKSKKTLEYLLDTLNYIYSEIKLLEKNLDSNIILLTLKPKIDSFLIGKDKESIYEIIKIAIKQWFDMDIGNAYLLLDAPSKILKNNRIYLPLPTCSELNFISPNLYHKHKNSFYDPIIRIMKINKIFMAEINFYYKRPTPKKIYAMNGKKATLVQNHAERKKLSLSKENYIMNNKITNIQSDIEKHKSNVNLLNKENEIQSIVNEKWISSLNEWKAYLNSFKMSKNSVDVEAAKEIIEAFQEVDRNRSSSTKKYLKDYYQHGSIGKFGVPQAKWRNGTYGISSKEPDFFSSLSKNI
ncbi:hypothetical protein [Acinetobacter junii]|uniref:hypothetical protein n=4 Tax=Acinetobacter junii TaxID=40215 RepID=UPI00124E949D|nr:hypothetical protein [Acinetobacter junii]MBL8280475.1 hypothetical protein [Acinetobacter junii]